MVQLFIDGGGFMWPILFIFIIGFVFVIERLYHLIKGLSSNKDFAYKIAETVKQSGFDSANCIYFSWPIIQQDFSASNSIS